MTSYYSREELEEIGFKSFGENVCLSRKVSIYGAHNMTIGDNVRIDDFCFLSGNLEIGSYIHIASFSGLFASVGKIVMEDFTVVSSRVAIYSNSDDYSGEHMTNPNIPAEYTGVYHKDVILKRHTIVGTGSTILPGCILEEGTAVAAMSLINKSTEAFGIYGGIPAKRLKERSKNLLELEKKFLMELS